MVGVDLVAALILGLAVLRGLWLGLVREAFSLAALAAAVLAVRFGLEPASEALREAPWAPLPELAVPLAAGAGLVLGAVLAVGLLGRIVRGSLHAAGLGQLDRLGGGLLGAAEGALVVGVLLLGAQAVLGAGHPWLAGSRAAAAVAEVRGAVGEDAAARPAVAAPPPRGEPGGRGR